uniref:RIN4 pathogenic type III effector avirulence factor Avr cleavage site domain-containing protein n=1 Tax=Quercus lobata TaxID=97700 RepID=A0A7N2KZW4_QUELO
MLENDIDVSSLSSFKDIDNGSSIDLLKLDKGRPLPKFGEWDVNNPASAEGFTVIFSKARDAKKSNGATGPGTGTGNGTGTGSEATATATAQRNDNSSRPPVENIQYTPMKKWFCCF